jgi:hypothetical protein
MRNERKVITFQEFVDHPDEIFEQVLQGEEIVVQSGENESVLLKRTLALEDEAILQRKIAALLSAAGSWADRDTEALKAQLRASRDMPPRPPVDL